MIALVIFGICILSGFWTIFWQEVTIRKQRRINDERVMKKYKKDFNI